MRMEQHCGVSVAYLVHDINDAAVMRRTNLLAEEGISVELAGFHRQTPPCAVARARTVLNLGHTRDARLVSRALSVAKHLLAPAALRKLCSGSSVILARNLEMLILAARVKTGRQRLVYECLDIHGLMLASGIKSQLLRRLERRLLRDTDLVVISSPAFFSEYFGKRQKRRDAVLLVENKVPADRRQALAAHPLADRPSRQEDDVPVVIGWFGMLRCRKTLAQLAALASNSNGRIEVLIAGTASVAEFPDFTADLAGLPGLRYTGSYQPEDLPRLYAAVDYVWAIDYFEEGLNSALLLPNRIYEGLAAGAVPIALKGVETGRWLLRHGVGVLVDDPLAELPHLLTGPQAVDRTAMRAAIARLPAEVLFQTDEERGRIVAAITGAVCA